MTGNLYVVSVPIGNLEDITYRAKRILGEVNYIVAEDTRQIGKLIKLLELPKKQYISYRDQNHEYAMSKILPILESGVDIALVSDRGTPLISDPGYKLVHELRDRGINVYSVPGPSAVTSALSISGLPTDRFIFLGFLPRKSGKQKQMLEQYGNLDATFVIYESPFRTIKLLENISEVLGDIKVSIARELTKQHEEVIRGSVLEVIEVLKKTTIKGEIVVMGRAT